MKIKEAKNDILRWKCFWSFKRVLDFVAVLVSHFLGVRFPDGNLFQQFLKLSLMGVCVLRFIHASKNTYFEFFLPFSDLTWIYIFFYSPNLCLSNELFNILIFFFKAMLMISKLGSAPWTWWIPPAKSCYYFQMFPYYHLMRRENRKEAHCTVYICVPFSHSLVIGIYWEETLIPPDVWASV